MLSKPTMEWTEQDLLDLATEGTPEGDRLDYKETLKLEKPSERAAIAKDVSSFANSSGGRLIYGIEEKTKGQDNVAGDIKPLTDPRLETRYADVLYERCQPNVRVRLKHIQVSGGYCLVVDVPESLFPIMATGSSLNRFYKRYQTKSTPMSEREIRERYERYATVRDNIERMLEEIDPYSGHPTPYWEGEHPGYLTLLFVPTFGPVGVFEPAVFSAPYLRDLVEEKRYDVLRYSSPPMPRYFGFEYPFNGERPILFTRLHTSGVVEFHCTLRHSDQANFPARTQADIILDVAEAAEALFRSAGYHADLRVIGRYDYLDGYSLAIDQFTRPTISTPKPLTYEIDTSVEGLQDARLAFAVGLLNRVSNAAGLARFPVDLIDGRNGTM